MSTVEVQVVAARLILKGEDLSQSAGVGSSVGAEIAMRALVASAGVMLSGPAWLQDSISICEPSFDGLVAWSDAC